MILKTIQSVLYIIPIISYGHLSVKAIQFIAKNGVDEVSMTYVKTKSSACNLYQSVLINKSNNAAD